MILTRKGSTVLPAAMGILGSVMVIGFASSTRSAATNRYLDSARARRMMSVVSRSVASEACFVLEETLGKEVGKGRMKARSEKLHNGGAPRTVEVPLTKAQFAGQRVTIGPVTAVFSPLKRHWDKKRDRDKGGKFKPQEEEDEFPQGNGVPGKGESGGAGEDDQPPTDEEANKEDDDWKAPQGGPGRSGAGAPGAPGGEPEQPFDDGEEDEKLDRDPEGGGRQTVFQQVVPEGGAGEPGGGGTGKGGKGKGKWRRRGAWGLMQLKFDVTVETQGAPLKRRIAIRRSLMVRKWGWHPMRIDVMDIAKSQEAIP